MPNPLISVIVPIYNVAPYLRKCLDSLKNQTMSEIEVICIDDGSTDESGKIAEEYKNEEGWPRFRTIHTENRGLSAARNRGIEESKADWLMFVDSDDWVEPEFCEVPYQNSMMYNSDLVIFGGIKEKRFRRKKMILDTEIHTGIASEFYAHEFGKTVVWNKSCKRYLFNCVHFPEGRVYEDAATTHKLIHVARRISIVNQSLYHYVQRMDSISHMHTMEVKQDAAIAQFERCEDLLVYGYPIEKMQGNLCSAAISILANITPRTNEMYVKAKGIIESMQKAPNDLCVKKRILFRLWKTDERLFHCICDFRRK